MFLTSYGVWSNQTTGAKSQEATLEITGASGTVFTVDTGDSSLGGESPSLQADRKTLKLVI